MKIDISLLEKQVDSLGRIRDSVPTSVRAVDGSNLHRDLWLLEGVIGLLDSILHECDREAGEAVLSVNPVA